MHTTIFRVRLRTLAFILFYRQFYRTKVTGSLSDCGLAKYNGNNHPKDKFKQTFNSMKKLQFKLSIKAPARRIYDFMLGINNKSTYEQWTALFNPTSTYEGSWDKGAKILFVGVDEKGEKGGMVSRIAENIPNRFVSIQHYGLLQAGKEITEGPEVEKWANGLENYTFEENNGTTNVTVDLDTVEDFVEYMNEHYPKALDKLKEICEK